MQEENKSGVFYMISAEQLEAVAQAASDKTAARLEAEKHDKILSRAQAAKALGVSVQTIWRWTASGILHAVNHGGKVFYKQSELMSIEL